MSAPKPIGPQGETDVIRANSLLFTCVLCLLWIVPGLVGHDPWQPDEAHNFGLVYHILQTGDWVVPTLAQEPVLERPPLFYLTAALLAKIFSGVLPLHDAARLASGLYMALTFLLVGLTTRELFGTGRGWLGALALLGSLGLLLQGHYLVPDVAELTGFALALYGLALCLRRPALGGLALGTGVGLAFLSKGLLTLGSMGIAAALLPVLAPQWRTRTFMVSLLVALVTALPLILLWPCLLHHRSPALFDEWFNLSGLGRLLRASNSGTMAQSGDFPYDLAWFAFSPLPLAAWSVWEGRRSLRTQPGLILPLSVFMAALALLSAAGMAPEIYAIPMLAPLAVLAVPGLLTLRRGAAHALLWFAILFAAFMALVGWFYWMGMDLGFPQPLHRHLMRMQPGYVASFDLFKVATGLALTLLWVWTLVRLRRSPERPLVAYAVGMTLIWGLALTLFMGYADSGKSYRPMVMGIAHALPPGYHCVSSRNLGEAQRAMLEYFAGIVTYRDEVPSRKRRCDFLLVQGLRSDIHEPDAGWTKVWEGARLGDNKELFELYRRS